MPPSISIHALVKRATEVYDFYLEQFRISIHALVKRATMFMRKTDADIKISIHALVKRATKTSWYSIATEVDFNPRPREEGDSKFIQ